MTRIENVEIQAKAITTIMKAFGTTAMTITTTFVSEYYSLSNSKVTIYVLIIKIMTL